MKNNTPKDSYVIIGGGLAGLFSAKVLLNRGCKNIYIIEKSSETGGLLQHTTVKNPLGDSRDFSFDYGTHFVLEPQDPHIKKLIQEDINQQEYHIYQGSLQEAHVLNGQLYEQSGCANISALSADKQTQIKKELKHLHHQNTPSNILTFKDECLQRYGNTATKEIYAPAYSKFTGMHLKNLTLSMGSFFAPSRLIINDKKTSKELKEDPDWDWRIAYTDCKDGTSDIVKYYPKQKGIGHWLNKVADNLIKQGVTILTHTTVERLETEESQLKKVHLSNGEVLNCKQLIWSLPAVFLAMLTKTDVPSQKPLMRQVLAINILTDKKPIERPYWITVYDEKIKSYRITLYDNFAPAYSDVYQITVEVLHGGDCAAGDELEQEIFNELKSMKIIDQSAQKLWSHSLNKPEGFPVLSSSHLETYIQQHNILEKKYHNLEIVGRRPDTGGGQIAIMDYIWKNIGE